MGVRMMSKYLTNRLSFSIIFVSLAIIILSCNVIIIKNRINKLEIRVTHLEMILNKTCKNEIGKKHE